MFVADIWNDRKIIQPKWIWDRWRAEGTNEGRMIADWNGVAVETRLIPVSGAEIAVHLAGAGPELVLLHGIGSNATSWLPVVDELSADYRLVMLDMRGHGASSRPERGYLIADYANDLDAVLAVLELERPLILGHSLGGMTALEWGINHPGRAAALAIEDSPMTRGGDGVTELFDGWIALSRMTVDEADAYYAGEYPEWTAEDRRRRAEGITSVAPGVFEELKVDMLAQGGAHVVGSYSGITTPTLLVYGDLATGGMVPGVLANLFAATISGARVAHIPGGTHNLHRDNKPAFLEAVQPFLREHR